MAFRERLDGTMQATVNNLAGLDMLRDQRGCPGSGETAWHGHACPQQTLVRAIAFAVLEPHQHIENEGMGQFAVHRPAVDWTDTLTCSSVFTFLFPE